MNVRENQKEERKRDKKAKQKSSKAERYDTGPGWVGNGYSYGKQRFRCTVCERVTVKPEVYRVAHGCKK
jgi:hypothetical protein